MLDTFKINGKLCKFMNTLPRQGFLHKIGFLFKQGLLSYIDIHSTIRGSAQPGALVKQDLLSNIGLVLSMGFCQTWGFTQPGVFTQTGVLPNQGLLLDMKHLLTQGFHPSIRHLINIGLLPYIGLWTPPESLRKYGGSTWELSPAMVSRHCMTGETTLEGGSWSRII